MVFVYAWLSCEIVTRVKTKNINEIRPKALEIFSRSNNVKTQQETEYNFVQCTILLTSYQIIGFEIMKCNTTTEDVGSFFCDCYDFSLLKICLGKFFTIKFNKVMSIYDYERKYMERNNFSS